MSTGLGVSFYNGPLPAVALGAFTLYTPKYDFAITRVYLNNGSQTIPALVEIGLTTGLNLFAGDQRKFLRTTLAPSGTLDIGTRIHFLASAGMVLKGQSSVGLGDDIVWASITGERAD